MSSTTYPAAGVPSVNRASGALLLRPFLLYQANQSNSLTSATSANLAYSSNVKQGSLLVVGVLVSNPTSDPVITLSDTLNSSWVSDAHAAVKDSGNQYVHVEIFHAFAGSAGAETVTATINNSSSIGLQIAEIGNAPSALSITTGTNSSATATAGANVATSTAALFGTANPFGNFGFAIYWANRHVAGATVTPTPGTGYTLGIDLTIGYQFGIYGNNLEAVTNSLSTNFPFAQSATGGTADGYGYVGVVYS